ncbi:DUF7144 family membrane protein [Kibdelosporangium phytohabitans]|uniref:DUF7144 domain-containing protein n=1 Tax=Kibdelosporangium phytohabitans TaxID=860235 RepID=A0A0N9HW25_9PSEU|nr:hypothetical protein [Kibdelosporangium phytohabitans]ALG09404.1 hypothetical protein AOZ06_23055 [Kibdelosporangium phytohabitans]MBE1469322.1 hypothetical protein [Kibdelosporangium phytohabitans]
MTDYPKRRADSRITVWSGWMWFAAIVMVLTGIFNAVEGLVALLDRAFYVSNGDDLILFDLTTWGWVHLLVGVLVLSAGLSLLTGAVWSRVVAVAVASVNAIAQITFVSAYPVWSTIVIALSVLVIWAIVVHGRDVTDEMP